MKEITLCSCRTCKRFYPWATEDVDPAWGRFEGGGGCCGNGIQSPSDSDEAFRDCWEEKR